MRNYDLTKSIRIDYRDSARAQNIVTFQVFPEKRTETSVANPKWRSQLGKTNATTPRYITERRIESYTPNDIRIFFNFNGNPEEKLASQQGVYGSSPNLFRQGSVPEIVKAQARAKAYAKLNDTTVHVNAGIIVGELSRTLQLLRDPLSALTGGARQYLDHVKYNALKANVRGLNQDRKRRVLQRIIADTWLEFEYGIQPLISDISDIALRVDYIKNRVQPDQVRSQFLWDSKEPPEYLYPTLDVIQTTVSTTQETLYKHYTTIGLLPSVTPELTTQFGLEGNQWLPTLWELIPYSFLVDYVANVGALASAAATVTSNVVYVSQTEIIEYRSKANITFKGLVNPNHPIHSIVSNKPGSITSLIKTLDRKNNLVFPSFAWKVPTLKQYTNVAALLLSSQRTSNLIRGL